MTETDQPSQMISAVVETDHAEKMLDETLQDNGFPPVPVFADDIVAMADESEPKLFAIGTGHITPPSHPERLPLDMRWFDPTSTKKPYFTFEVYYGTKGEERTLVLDEMEVIINWGESHD